MPENQKELNALLGEPVTNWQAPLLPEKQTLQGQYCYLEPLNTSHCTNLWQAYNEPLSEDIWQYLPYGPFTDRKIFEQFIDEKVHDSNNHFYAICEKESQISKGFIAYSRIQPQAGSIEVAHICLSKSLQKTRMATEAIYLMVNKCFDLSYRRCEWKCNRLNQKSKKAAERFGFTYEGCFRQAGVIKGRNRDTAWYSILDSEWSLLKTAFIEWLSENNFDNNGIQKKTLKECR